MKRVVYVKRLVHVETEAVQLVVEDEKGGHAEVQEDLGFVWPEYGPTGGGWWLPQGDVQ